MNDYSIYDKCNMGNDMYFQNSISMLKIINDTIREEFVRFITLDSMKIWLEIMTPINEIYDLLSENLQCLDFHTYNDERPKHAELYKNYMEDYGLFLTKNAFKSISLRGYGSPIQKMTPQTPNKTLVRLATYWCPGMKDKAWLTIIGWATILARRCAKNPFGILAGHLCVFKKPISMGRKNANFAIKAAVALHNFLIDSNLKA
uniref:Transposase n=1 Tax=Romanomermis culicivorax TaxID=13658 RepID=A0A915K0R4_ROMCU